jgi:ankyrin repeat protein
MPGVYAAVDSDGDLPFQIAARHGNWVVLDWIFRKWKENGYSDLINVNKVDSEGYTALMHCCLLGYSLGQSKNVAKLE